MKSFYAFILLYPFSLLLLFLLFYSRLKKELKKCRRQLSELETENRQLLLDMKNAKNESLAKSEFLARLSHEIRNPLHAIIGISSLLSNHAIEEKKIDDYFKQIHISSTHLLSLINDVLDISALESGKTKINREAFLLPSTLSMVKLICQNSCTEKNITLNIDSHTLTKQCFYGDEQKLKQILINLVCNAIKFSPENETVDLFAEEASSEGETILLRFLIHDRGCGIEKSFMDKLFLPFEQAPAAQNSDSSGSGLGLAITKSFAEMLNGTVSAESEPENGTTFTVTIPFQQKESSKPELSRQASQKKFDFSHYTALIAEDNQLNSDILKRILEHSGIKVLTAQNGQEAVDKFLTSPPKSLDIIFLDIEMPVLTGEEAARKIRSSLHPDAASIPIYTLSAYSPASKNSSMPEGLINGHIPKPIDNHILYDIIERALEEQKSS